jgi:hypothetical protein
MTKRAKTFDKVLKEVAVPELKKTGFHYDGGRTFRKIINNGTAVQIINLQLGQRSKEGKFTVNLGVFHAGDSAGVILANAYEYHCKWAKRIRIGQLIPSKLRRLQVIPFIGWLFGSFDRWWKFSEDSHLTRKNIALITDIIISYGITWLESKVAAE